MNVEEKDGLKPRPRKIVLGGQRERANSQDPNYERKPAYRGTSEGSGYQSRDNNSSTPSGRRPRIKEIQRVNYGRPAGNRPEEGNRGGYPNQSRYSQSAGSGERRPYQPRSSQQYGGGEDRPYTPRYSQSDSGERQNRPSYQSRSGSTEGGYRGRQQTGGYNANRSTYNAGRGGDSRYGNKQQPRRTGDYNPNAKYNFQKQLKYKEALTDPNEPIRLNKFLANAGVCSRREADEFIKAGAVKVNDKVVTELGTKISRMDTVVFHEKTVQIESKLYILLNKPKNCVTTSDDPQERLTVMDLVRNACKERIYPVGRLDRNTTGVLLLTNDGDLASKLTHPSFKKKKIYHVWLDKNVAIGDMEKIANGIELEDGEIHADAISYANEEDKDQVGIEIHSGRNRIVRRMFESLGYHVMKLDRVYFAGLTKKNLPRGKWRYLNEREVNTLRMGAFE